MSLAGLHPCTCSSLKGSPLPASVSNLHSLVTLLNMPEDPSSLDSRLSNFECAIDGLRSQSTITELLLQTIQSMLDPSTGTGNSHSHSNVPICHCTMGKAFPTPCQVFICLCPGAFEDEVTKIVWAVSYNVWKSSYKTGKKKLRLDWTTTDQNRKMSRLIQTVTTV